MKTNLRVMDNENLINQIKERCQNKNKNKYKNINPSRKNFLNLTETKEKKVNLSMEESELRDIFECLPIKREENEIERKVEEIKDLNRGSPVLEITEKNNFCSCEPKKEYRNKIFRKFNSHKEQEVIDK